MTQQDKELLLKDLSARLPYGVMCNKLGIPHRLLSIDIYQVVLDNGDYMPKAFDLDGIKPYLRSMSSMTEKEYKEYRGWVDAVHNDPAIQSDGYFDWLNKNMFDYRGLIPMGLANEVTEENNPYKD